MYINMKTTKKTFNENDYHFQSIVKEKKQNLIDSIEKTKKEIELLKSVKIVTKKDWSEFKNFLQNFQCNWKIYNKSYPFEDRINISNYPIEIDIKNKSYDNDLIEEIRKNDPNRIYSHSYKKDYIIFTVKEFYDQIQKTIENRQKRLKQYEKELKNFDNDLEESKKILNQVYDLFIKLDNRQDNWYYNQKEILEKTIKSMYIY